MMKALICHFCPAGDALQDVTSRAHDIGSSAMSVPAGIFATLSGNARDVPRLLVSDVLAVYNSASDALADLNARGEIMLFACQLTTLQCMYYTTLPGMHVYLSLNTGIHISRGDA